MKPFVGMIIYSGFNDINGAKITMATKCKFCGKPLWVVTRLNGSKLLVEYDEQSCALIRHKCSKIVNNKVKKEVVK